MSPPPHPTPQTSPGPAQRRHTSASTFLPRCSCCCTTGFQDAQTFAAHMECKQVSYVPLTDWNADTECGSHGKRCTDHEQAAEGVCAWSRAVTASSSCFASGLARSVILALPAAPLASPITVSFVLVSPSTDIYAVNRDFIHTPIYWHSVNKPGVMPTCPKSPD